MITAIRPSKIEEKLAQPIQATHIQEVAETIRDDALALAQSRLTPALQGLDLRRLLRRADFVDTLKYGLATGVANVLADNDAHVTALYMYEPSANPDSELGNDLPIDPTVHMLMVVQSSSPALEALIASLDHALTESLRDWPSSRFAERSSLLDVNLLTEKDIQLGRGYAVLLSSRYAPPLKIWQR